MSELNQIEEIEKLYAKPKAYKIPVDPKDGQTQINVNIMPLGLKDMGLMKVKEDTPMDELSKNITSIWAVSLQIDEEKAGKISIEFMQDVDVLSQNYEFEADYHNRKKRSRNNLSLI